MKSGGDNTCLHTDFRMGAYGRDFYLHNSCECSGAHPGRTASHPPARAYQEQMAAGDEARGAAQKLQSLYDWKRNTLP